MVAEDGQSARVYSVVIVRGAGVAALSSLSLAGVDVGAFDASITGYSAQVPNGLARTTVSATPMVEGATVEISPADADPDATGHQVDLAVSANEISVTVTVAGGAAKTYRVMVTRALSPPMVTLEAPLAVVEGAPVVVVATLDREPEAAVELLLSVAENGTFLSGAPPASVTVPGGASRAVLELPTEDDAVVEGDGSVAVTLLAGAGYAIGADGTATATVTDNDTTRFEVTAHPGTVEEGGAARVTVAIVNGVTFASDRTVTLSVTGLDASEYRLASTMLDLPAGAASVTSTFEVLEDGLAVAAETAEIQAAVAGEAIGGVSVEVVDAGPPPSLSGVPQVGSVLQALVGDAAPAVEWYEWLRDTEPIPGATAASHALVEADAGAALSVRINVRGRWRTSAPTVAVWPAPANPPPAVGEEVLLATMMTLETHFSPKQVTGYSRLAGREFGTVDAAALGAERELSLFVVNDVGLFGMAADPAIEDATDVTAYWDGHAMGPLELSDGARYWVAPPTQPREEYSRYKGGASDGVRVAVSLRRRRAWPRAPRPLSGWSSTGRSG